MARIATSASQRNSSGVHPGVSWTGKCNNDEKGNEGGKGEFHDDAGCKIGREQYCVLVVWLLLAFLCCWILCDPALDSGKIVLTEIIAELGT